MNSQREITILYEPLDDLLASKRIDNPKLHDRAAITESIERVGYVNPILRNGRDGSILAGHGRLDVVDDVRRSGLPPPPGIRLDGAGTWLIPVVHGIDLDPDQATAFLVADNRTVELGGWDEAKLAQVLLDLSDTASGIGGSGFSGEDLDRLVSSLLADIDRQGRDPDEVPDDVEVTDIEPGNVYLLGPHRVACGDSRDPDLMATLVGTGQIDCLLTDPPYGVDYRGKSGPRLTIANDHERGLADLLTGAFGVADGVLRPGAPVYVFHPAGPLSLTFGAAVCAAGWQFRQSLVWYKSSGVLGRSDYHYAHEPIVYATKPGTKGRGRSPWYGGRDQTSVFEFPRPRQSSDHPTMKPVGLLEALLKNSTQRGDTVLDPFLGSGSTLIAAERLGRRCLGIDLEPRFVQLVITRWERLSGGKAVLADRHQKEVAPK